MSSGDSGEAEPLRFADLSQPGISRRRCGKGWRFVGPDGRTISDPGERRRLLAIGLPPAYQKAWYNPDPDGHIQAVGIDARGRRQYRYHVRFRADREEAKFQSLSAFGSALPSIRARVDEDLARRGPCRERVVAAVVRLLDLGRIRIGNERYARDNRSFGATTLRTRHVSVEGGRVMLLFRAKHGIQRRMSLSDRALARAVRQCQELPGQHLFCYLDEDGESRPITSQDVNDYLHDLAGQEISAKHFRTWWASVIALDAATRGASLTEAMAEVAQMLGNTPAVTRKSYVHPQVIATLRGTAEPPTRGRGPMVLSPEERRLMALLARQDEAASDVLDDGESGRSERRMKEMRPSGSTTATATS